MEIISDADVVADINAAPIGEPDVDVDDHQLHPLQSTVGPTEAARSVEKNVHTLPTDTRRMRPLLKLWAAIKTGATTSPNDRRV